ncbi:Outer membrane protein, beta-barrel, partial [Metarhizium majus ARSEF 297]
MSSEHTGFPILQPAFTIKVHVGEGNPVGDISTGQQFIHFQTPSGTIKSLPGFKPEVDAEIVFGGDWLYFDPDKSRARINFKGIAKTKFGAPFSFYYAGIVTIDHRRSHREDFRLQPRFQDHSIWKFE